MKHGSPAALSSIHQRIDYEPNSRLELPIFDAAGTIPLCRTDIDHRIELNPIIAALTRIPVDAPDVALNGSVVEEQRLFVNVKLATDRHDAAADVNDGLDHHSESALRQLRDFREGNAFTHKARAIGVHAD